MNLKSVTKWLFDIRFWIVLLLLIRFENINLPALDEHAWRQTITLGVARNYLEVSPNFFEPRTVLADSRSGIIAQEFPLYNYALAMIWKVFGQENWCFRVFSLLIASIGLLYFNKIGRRMIGARGALFATVIFGVSVAFMYARKATPDVFSVSLVLIGVEYAWRYLDEQRPWQMLLFILFAALGMLCKMPAACVMGLLAAPIFSGAGSNKKKLAVVAGGTLAVAMMAAWYFYWVPWADKTFGFSLFYPTGLVEGWQQLVAMRVDTLSRFYPIALTSRIAFLFCVAGLGLMVWKKKMDLIWAFGASSALLIGLMLKAGGTFSGHVYYIIPYVPMMSLLAGYGLSELIKNQWLQMVLLIAIATEAIYLHKDDFFIPWQDEKFLKLEKIVDQFVPKESRILVNNREGSPVMMYFAHRRGWTVTDRMKDSAWVAGESTVGMDFLVIERTRWQDTLPFAKLYEDNEFQVYKTKKD